MKKLNVKAVLNMNGLSIPSKINKARLVTDAVSVNVGTFVSPVPDIPTMTAAIDDLETAWHDAADGGKSKKAIMHDKEADLMKLMIKLAHYVEDTADGDENVIHLAALDTKKVTSRLRNQFEVNYGSASGSVQLRVKALNGGIYKWQYSTDPTNASSWVAAGESFVSKFNISGLTPGKVYWFRVAVKNKTTDLGFSDLISIIVI